MKLKLAFEEAMKRHNSVLNVVASDRAGDMAADPDLLREAASLITATLFGGSDDEEPAFEGVLARTIYETIPR